MRNEDLKIAIPGIDLGKNRCCLVGLDLMGKCWSDAACGARRLLLSAPSYPTCIIAMEACCGSHHMGRILAAHGHTVRLMSFEFVRPYVKAQKNDNRDAEAIAEAATRPTMRFVELKSKEQFDIQTRHRVRDQLINT